MNHPITSWYLAQARMDDINRAISRPHVTRDSGPGLLRRLSAHLPHRHHLPTAPASPAAVQPMGCAA